MHFVAPHVGAWIEIGHGPWQDSDITVAPHVGAWIEMSEIELHLPSLASHPMWVRGLKLPLSPCITVGDEVAPHVGAWIEILQATP